MFGSFLFQLPEQAIKPPVFLQQFRHRTLIVFRQTFYFPAEKKPGYGKRVVAVAVCAVVQEIEQSPKHPGSHPNWSLSRLQVTILVGL